MQTLQKITRLKEQKAQRRLYEIQKAQEKIDLEVEMLMKALDGSVQPSEVFGAVKLAIQNRFPERTARELERLKVLKHALIQEEAALQRELKIALRAGQEFGF